MQVQNTVTYEAIESDQKNFKMNVYILYTF